MAVQDEPNKAAHKAAIQAGEQCRLAAHKYADAGWSVTVLCPPDHAGVTENHAKNCRNPGKRPWHLWKGCQEIAMGHAEIDRLFCRNPQSNVGICLGPASGLVRIDVDGPGGEKRLAELSHGDLPPTLEFTGRRGNGSRGLLYAIPPGVELRTTSKMPAKGEELSPSGEGCSDGLAAITSPQWWQLRMETRPRSQ